MLYNLTQQEQINLVCNLVQSHEMLGIHKTIRVRLYAWMMCMQTCIICICV